MESCEINYVQGGVKGLIVSINVNNNLCKIGILANISK